jgi:hypothetical protein
MLKLPRHMLLVLLLPLSVSSAFAGPPFQTDDPDPVPYRHFETYLFELSDGTHAGGTVLELPAWELNWGAAPNLQLHIVVPLATSFAADSGPVNFGIADTELGAKYRFVAETKHRPEIGTFPFVELPTGSPSRGLGVGKTWYRLPIWIQKSWGQWTSYGGGGEVLVNEPGYKDYTFAGWLLQRNITKKLILGGEVFSHGTQVAEISARSSTMADVGGYYTIHDGFQLLFASGHSFAGESETYSYFALYWTWGRSKHSQDTRSFYSLLPRL